VFFLERGDAGGRRGEVIRREARAARSEEAYCTFYHVRGKRERRICRTEEIEDLSMLLTSSY